MRKGPGRGECFDEGRWACSGWGADREQYRRCRQWGMIDLRLTDSIEIEGIQDLNRADLKVPSGDEGVITSQSKAGGSGGKIKIEADKLLSKAGAAILADARGDGDGGSIEIKVGELDMDGSAVGHSSWDGSFLLEDLPQIRATTFGSGKGGVIEIDTEK